MRFDERNLVSCAGLLPAALAPRLGLAGVIDQRLWLAREGGNSATKALTVIGSMLADGDCIDDTIFCGRARVWRWFDQRMSRAGHGRAQVV